MKAGKLLAVAVLASLVGGGSIAHAAPSPAWSIETVAVPTNLSPGSSTGFYEVLAVNSGGDFTDGTPVIIEDVLPQGFTVEGLELSLRTLFGREDAASSACKVEKVNEQSTVTCEISEALLGFFQPARLGPGGAYQLIIHVGVPLSAAGSQSSTASIQGGGSSPKSTQVTNEVSEQSAPSGLSYFHAELIGEDGTAATQAGDHPYQYVTSFAANTESGPPGGSPFVPANGDIKDVEIALPPGLVGNPTAVSQCTAQEFAQQRVIITGTGTNVFKNGCPDGSVVGYIFVRQLEGISERLYEPIYELVPPYGMPAQFGFQVLGAPFYINTKVRTGSDYGITAFLPNTNEVKRITGARAVFWGVPADSAHNPFRGSCLNEGENGPEGLSLGSCSAGISVKPLLTMPTFCSGPLLATFSFNTWTNPFTFSKTVFGSPGVTGCGALTFSPGLSVVPISTMSDTPTGLAVTLHIPQEENQAGLSEPNLRDAVIQLPKSMTVNPASGGGLASCSPDQIGLLSAAGVEPASFTASPALCPETSKLGSVEVNTPLLDHPIRGGVFLAAQGDNPFGSLLAIYLAAYDPLSGVVVKLAGRVEADAVTGQLTTRFQNNPQLPFEDLSVVLFDGPRAPLRTPVTCGSYTASSDLRPWSAPQSGPDSTPSDTFSISSAPTPGICPTEMTQLPHSPSLLAGTQTPLAGRYSPLQVRLKRSDGTQEISGLSVSLPRGVTARLAEIPYCSESALAAASLRSGQQESTQPSCGAASKIGTAKVGVGAGPQPYFVEGAAYLAGPYHEAPLSIAVVTPALAGPLDLGTVVVRAALNVDTATAQVTAVSDPLPTILEGIPLDIRDIQLNFNRSKFSLNPTNCERGAVTSSVTSTTGAIAGASTPFQVGGCGGLAFAPKLSLALRGGTRRSGHPSLRAVLKMKAGEANVAGATVLLPVSEFIDQGHINNPCTRVEFSKGDCPKKSILGTARAVTPLLDQPIEGPVYFRSNGGARELPDIVADLRGQIHIVLIGFVDSVQVKGTERAKIRSRFATVPDAPVTKFMLRLKGGKSGLLVNSQNLCSHPRYGSVKLRGQNGKRENRAVRIKTSCG
jgi:hypothetical protein